MPTKDDTQTSQQTITAQRRQENISKIIDRLILRRFLNVSVAVGLYNECVKRATGGLPSPQPRTNTRLICSRRHQGRKRQGLSFRTGASPRLAYSVCKLGNFSIFFSINLRTFP